MPVDEMRGTFMRPGFIRAALITVALFFAGAVALRMDATGAQTPPVLALGPGVTNYGNGYAEAEVHVAGNLVILSGVVKLNSPNATLIATLPLGARPHARMIFSAASNVGAARVDVGIDGRVTAINRENQWISLSGITFSTK